MKERAIKQYIRVHFDRLMMLTKEELPDAKYATRENRVRQLGRKEFVQLTGPEQLTWASYSYTVERARDAGSQQWVRVAPPAPPGASLPSGSAERVLAGGASEATRVLAAGASEATSSGSSSSSTSAALLAGGASESSVPGSSSSSATPLFAEGASKSTSLGTPEKISGLGRQPYSAIKASRGTQRRL
mmetsp:Transcript_68107/g.192454  ORF Transcript_68107/g.192454 Transcript_68107/m.192454 type:complete len:188 (-) Transcript_68107:479-1042(-)